MAVQKEKLLELQSQAVYDSLGIEIKWRFGKNLSGGKCSMLAYVDARDVQTLFDHVCGQDSWCNEPLNINNKLYMQIGINIDGEGWVYKSDVGTESNVEKVKGESSDALKRAAVMWGAFRNLYSMEEKILPVKQEGGKAYPCTAGGKILYTGKQQTAYCNGQNTQMGNLAAIYTEFKPQIDADESALAAVKVLKEFLKRIKE